MQPDHVLLLRRANDPAPLHPRRCTHAVAPTPLALGLNVELPHSVDLSVGLLCKIQFEGVVTFMDGNDDSNGEQLCSCSRGARGDGAHIGNRDVTFADHRT